MINSYKAPLGGIIDDDIYGEWKIQLTMQINFISSLDTGEIQTIDSKSKKVEILWVAKQMILLKNFLNLF